MSYRTFSPNMNMVWSLNF